MQQVHLWKIPKDKIPALKEEYIRCNWLYLISQWNEYMIGEHLCPVCPASVDRVKDGMKGIFKTDVEVMHREGRAATDKEVLEMFLTHVAPGGDVETACKISGRFLVPVVAAFVNEDLRRRGKTERMRRRIMKTVFRVSWDTFTQRMK